MNIGSVSHATMRMEDLIPAFLAELESQCPRHKMIKVIGHAMEEEGYFDSDAASDDLEGLFDALNEYAPEYFYFGAHPGDGSDYGYWLSEEWEQQLEDDGGIKVNDISEIPKDHVGHVAVITDHGNVTLYRRGRNHQLKEIWAIV